MVAEVLCAVNGGGGQAMVYMFWQLFLLVALWVLFGWFKDVLFCDVHCSGGVGLKRCCFVMCTGRDSGDAVGVVGGCAMVLCGAMQSFVVFW
ncbi:Hypothetical predicted protein [Olea europaea subsp. europaea]|uniref:Transmembrane protein n=1 Tax=Olea europaea subsp. europaea TaxID=158383 RepID=A0A8S0SCG4_OLEEU|nr:Hypothetical predicted protein [Olea europaea subsp. europaea]